MADGFAFQNLLKELGDDWTKEEPQHWCLESVLQKHLLVEELVEVDLKLELLPPMMHEPPVPCPLPEMEPIPIPAQSPPPAPPPKLRQFPLPYPVPEVVLVTAARGKHAHERNPQAVDEWMGSVQGWEVNLESAKCL